jgi:prolyl-tRNA editing enzyme YbaK/EbsC (Cys-tRNA(Pro) deacylase)
MRNNFSPQGLILRRPEEIEALLRGNGIQFDLIRTKPVYTCREAAAARHVPLHHELKTLLVIYRNALALLNLPGDRRIDRKFVRTALAAHEFRLANVYEIASLRLSRGIISPLSLVGCRSLVDIEVLELEWVTTNAGSLTVGIRLEVDALFRMCELEIASLAAVPGDP